MVQKKLVKIIGNKHYGGPKQEQKIHFDGVGTQQSSVTFATKRRMLRQNQSAEMRQTLKIEATQPRSANLVRRQVISHKHLGLAVK